MFQGTMFGVGAGMWVGVEGEMAAETEWWLCRVPGRQICSTLQTAF